MAYHNNFPSHPSTPSYSFKDRYKVHNGYKILHLPSLVYPNTNPNTPSSIYLDVATSGGALILGCATHFVTHPSAVQTVVTGDTIIVYSALIKLKSAANVTGLKLGAGYLDGQHLTIINEGAARLTFNAPEATSGIKGGVDVVLGVEGTDGTGAATAQLIWNTTDNLWWMMG